MILSCDHSRVPTLQPSLCVYQKEGPLKHLRNKKGQGLVEYMVIVALMAVATMGLMRILSKTTSGKLAQITQSLQGGKASVSVEFEKIEQDDVRKKDMSDFFQGSRSRKDR